MKVKVYVMFYDYGGDEGCSSPERIATSKDEAEQWLGKDEIGQRAYSEFEIEVKEKECSD